MKDKTMTAAHWTGNGQPPTLAHEGDAGFDLAYNGNQPLVIQPGETANIPTGISVALPTGMWAAITGRSSAFKKNLLTPLSIIDNGYRGELFAIVRNIGDTAVTIEPLDRVAQLIPMVLHADHIEWVYTETLNDTTRGANGFGSTGR